MYWSFLSQGIPRPGGFCTKRLRSPAYVGQFWSSKQCDFKPSNHFQQHISPYVSGFRKGYDCQSVLLRFSESVKRHLDNSEVAGALLTYLSKAFNCLPHDLLVCNMYAYGLSEASCKLIASYLKDRYHRVNIGTERWLETSEKGHSTRINNGSLCV